MLRVSSTGSTRSQGCCKSPYRPEITGSALLSLRASGHSGKRRIIIKTEQVRTFEYSATANAVATTAVTTRRTEETARCQEAPLRAGTSTAASTEGCADMLPPAIAASTPKTVQNDSWNGEEISGSLPIVSQNTPQNLKTSKCGQIFVSQLWGGQRDGRSDEGMAGGAAGSAAAGEQQAKCEVLKEWVQEAGTGGERVGGGKGCDGRYSEDAEDAVGAGGRVHGAARRPQRRRKKCENPSRILMHAADCPIATC
eukprot:2774896-Rhodomonas_salina.1